MALLIAGMILWTVAHGLKIHAPARRAALVEQYGEGTVKIAATVAMLAAVAMIVIGYQRADYVALWTPPGWTTHLNNLAMVFALGIYVAAPIPSQVRHWIRHPQLTGTKIWAAAHLLVNGHLAALILFGGMLAWAVAAVIGINKRDGKGPKPGPGTLIGSIGHLVLAGVLTVIVALVHNWLGVWPFAGDPPG